MVNSIGFDNQVFFARANTHQAWRLLHTYLPPSDVVQPLFQLSSSSSEQFILSTRTTGSGFCFMVVRFTSLQNQVFQSNVKDRDRMKHTTDWVLLFVLFIHQDKQTYSDWCLISQKDNNEISWYASPDALSSR